METRKIQVVGNRSFSVSLPKLWVSSNSLKAQDSVFIETTADHSLIITPHARKQMSKEALSVNLHDIHDVKEFLVFCYVKNIERVTLVNPGTDLAKVRDIRHILKHLDGYDITNEDEHKIEISFLFKDTVITVQKILHRMVYLLRLMVTALEKKEYESLSETETATDRLYHLSKRVLFACVRDYNMRKENGISHDEDLFFYSTIMKKLENFGDQLLALHKHTISKKEAEALLQMVDFLEELLVKRKLGAKTKSQLEKISLKAFSGESRALAEHLHSTCSDIVENMLSIEFNAKYF